MFWVGLPCYLELNSGRLDSINVNKTRKHFPEKFMTRECFPGLFCFEDVNYAYATQQGILTKIRSCKHLQKFCEHEQASIRLIFASNSSKGQILRALSNLMGPFDTPSTQGSVGTRRRSGLELGRQHKITVIYTRFFQQLIKLIIYSSTCIYLIIKSPRAGRRIRSNNTSGFCAIKLFMERDC